MIRLIPQLPPLSFKKAECVRLLNIYECYRDEALFWEQDDARAYICMLGSDMTVLDINADTEELSEFIGVLSPESIFSSEDTLKNLGLCPLTVSSVMAKKSDERFDTHEQELKSSKIYAVFKAAELDVPQYEHFAVDLCRRVNHGHACFYLGENSAAYSIHSGEYALIQGIASLKKGEGSLTLARILQKNYGRTVLACCCDEVRGFYEKNGFIELYKAAQWVK